jgi:hypothetical protein
MFGSEERSKKQEQNYYPDSGKSYKEITVHTVCAVKY